MVRSAPKVSFNVTSINYGTIDVGTSSAEQFYTIYQSTQSKFETEAINMSISFKEGTNASEARKESWVYISHADEATYIESVGGKEATIGSIVAGRWISTNQVSKYIMTKVKVPTGAATAGAVTFYLHHRYQYTGDDDDD